MLKRMYRLRWQIELIFKNWKSIGKIHKHTNMKAERLKATLISKFLYFFLNLKILKIFEKDLLREKQAKFSLWKVFCILEINIQFIWINKKPNKLKNGQKITKNLNEYALFRKENT